MTAETNGHSPRSGSVQGAARPQFSSCWPRGVHARPGATRGGAAPQAPDVA
eukprot:CAMPEP_0168473584 /NCGR_PEP_ID=MMETSP0228-20121227/60401_1 /TAXON_ID=133427 /ORGANISM="Protoceratium reticulatum, Strain CCCM 535 (=CCMP 1889)" /LENGTH=50 /DNA_ID=CAMNT_0008489585 /DNA_START=61 /DNA_END=209 /DNA_ORIENTATION=+